MVDIEGVFLQTIQNMLCSESSDSGIMSDYNSDCDNVSMAEEVDYSKRLHEAMR